MNYPQYSEKLLTQYKKAIEVYAGRIYQPVFELNEVGSLKTKEHFRVPPKPEGSICKGESWGGLWQNIWLSFDIETDERFAGKQLWLIVDTGATEVMCFLNGEPRGLINNKNNFIAGQHSAFFVCRCEKKSRLHIDLECYAGHFQPGGAPYDNYGKDDPNEADYVKRFDGIRVCVMDETMNRMVFDVCTVMQLAQIKDGNNFMRGRAMRALKEAFPVFIQDPVHYSREELDEAALEVCRRLSPVLQKTDYNDGTRGHVSLIGHSHMDTAWLWPYSETIRKCARTYSEALSLMERYPDYSFIQSSALHISWMETYYPSIYRDMRQRILEGRYEPNGGVWVECDCNITGGEAMVRQFFYGQRYTREKFGYTSDCYWLPDTFGYNAAIPQIMLGAEVKYFLTTKISWNDLNKMTTDTFRWRGLDGSEVLTHFNRMHTMPDPESILRCVDDILDKESADSRLLAYGYGDGGGGPTYGMLEYISRAKDLPGLPELKTETVSKFMQRLDERREEFPVYDGELYLEFHRGTLTSIHDIKRNNRKAEIALHNLEFLNAAAGEKENSKTEYLYKELLRNQFHDILPGSSMAEVNDTARQEVTAVIEGARAEGATYLGAPSTVVTTLVNASPFDWQKQDVYEAEGELQLEGVLAQPFTDVMGRKRTALMGLELPAYHSAKFANATAAVGAVKAESPFVLQGDRLTTPLYEVCFDENGYITSLTDRKSGRDFARKDALPLGTLLMGENMPYNYENWEISPSQEMKMKPITALKERQVVADGAVEWRVRAVYALSDKSSVTVDTVFHAASPVIDYQMKVDWHEKRQLLKIAFDVAVKANTVKNEIQFGYMERPTTRNTSYEAAKYEVVNHRWSDLSDSRGGVALLNDCKYGMSAKGSMLTLTLMHGGKRPDPRADEGVHEMTCALAPHEGYFSTQKVIAPAYKLNMPLLKSHTDCTWTGLFELEGEHVICETVKCAADVENAYVLRLYECEGVEAKAKLHLGAVKEASLVNLLEEEKTKLALADGCAELELKPFELVTVLVKR